MPGKGEEVILAMCDCERALELISQRLDGPLTAEEAEELESHLSGCADCRALASELAFIHDVMPELEETVPQGLHQAIMDRIGAEKVRPFPRRKGGGYPLRRWASLAAVFVLLLLGAGPLREFLMSGGSSESAAPAVLMAGADDTLPKARDGALPAPTDEAQADPEEAALTGEAAETETTKAPSAGETSSVENGVDVQTYAAPLPDESGGGESGALQSGEVTVVTEGSYDTSGTPRNQPQATAAPAVYGEKEKSGDDLLDGTQSPAGEGQATPAPETLEALKSNCAAWLAASDLECRDRVDTGLVSAAPVTEGDLAAAVCGGEEQRALLDGTDWAVTVGDTAGHDFAVLLCDSQTLAVLGYVPVE